VKRLPDKDRVQALVRQRDPFRGAVERRNVGKTPIQLIPHIGIGFDRGHLKANGHQAFGELSGTGPEIEHLPGRMRRAGQRPANSVHRIVGAVLGIGGRVHSERARPPGEQGILISWHVSNVSRPTSDVSMVTPRTGSESGDLFALGHRALRTFRPNPRRT
jgi:hypothetical protein